MNLIASLVTFNEVKQPLNITSYLNYIRNQKAGMLSEENKIFEKALYGRIHYIFKTLKKITNSSITDFNFINSYDNDKGLGFFDPIEFNKFIEICGEFTDKYSKPFGSSFPVEFLFNNFEEKSAIIYSNFLMEQTIIFDCSCKLPAMISPKEFTYSKMIDDLALSMNTH